jgi:hypothetical protein
MSDLPKNFGNIPQSRVSFADKLSALCAMELSNAHGDPARIGAMIERLANSMAFTIAIAAHGDAKTIDDMLSGATSYLYEAATSHQRMGEFMAKAKRG